MSHDVVHVGKRSWWDGTVRTLCGREIPSGDAKSKFFGPTCPACRKAKKDNGK